MKVYSAPVHLRYEPDYSNYNREVERAKEDQFRKDVIGWLRENGWDGPNTGGIARFGVADGYAEYILGEATKGSGNKDCLIHMQFGDGYSYQHVQYLPKAEILQAIARDKALKEIFSKK